MIVRTSAPLAGALRPVMGFAGSCSRAAAGGLSAWLARAVAPSAASALIGISLVLGAGACSADVERALEAADLAAAHDCPEQEERLLQAVVHRLGRQRTRAARAAPAEAAQEQERALWRRLGELYAGALRDPQAALDAYEAALALAPPSTETGAIQLARGELLDRALRDKASAAHAFEAAAASLGERPGAARASLAAGERYLALGNAARSQELCERVVAGWPGSADAARAHLLLGHTHVTAGRVPEAIATYESLLAARPAAPLAAVAKARLAQVHQGRGESAQALDYYQAALAHHPNAPMVQDAIARLREQMVQSTPNRSILRGAGGNAQVARR